MIFEFHLTLPWALCEEAKLIVFQQSVSAHRSLYSCMPIVYDWKPFPQKCSCLLSKEKRKSKKKQSETWLGLKNNNSNLYWIRVRTDIYIPIQELFLYSVDNDKPSFLALRNQACVRWKRHLCVVKVKLHLRYCTSITYMIFETVL